MRLMVDENIRRVVLIILLSLLLGGTGICQHWETLKAQGDIVPRQDCGFVSSEGIFYLLGGNGIKPVNIFNHESGQWSRGAAPPVEMHHFQAISFRGKIYVMGGLTGSYPEMKPLDHIYIYDPHEDRWETGAAIPEERRRGSSGAVAYRGKFYMVCGIVSEQAGSHKPWLDSYDPLTGEWKKLADAPHDRDRFHAEVIDGKIYAAGGRNAISADQESYVQTIPEVDVYDIKSNRWVTLPDSLNLPTERAGCTAAVWNDQLLVIGGENRFGEQALNVVELYDVDHRKWISWPSMNQGRQGTQAFMCIGSIFIASGSDTRGEGSKIKSIEELILYE